MQSTENPNNNLQVSHNYLEGGLPTVILCVLIGSSIQQNAGTALLYGEIRQ